MKNYLKIIFYFGILILLLSVSCNNNTATDPSIEKIWRENEDGTIVTTDLQRLQKITPFDIVLPEYLPDDLVDTIPTFLYEIRTLISDYVYISIMYGTPDSIGLVNISEKEIQEGFEYEIEDIQYPESEQLFTVNEVTIQEQGNDMQYEYNWLNSGLVFNAYIDGYSQDKSRKIVESMIR